MTEEYQPGSKGNWKNLFIFANPRSGSTFLLRMLHLGCHINISGDPTWEFWKRILSMYRTVKTLDKDRYTLAEDRTYKFVPGMQLMSANHKLRCLREFISMSLCGSGLHLNFKTTDVGIVEHEKGVEFIHMIRELYKAQEPTFVFLYRDVDEIVESMMSPGCKEFQPVRGAHGCSESVLTELIEKQNEVLKKGSRLGDVVLTYKQLVEDPIKILKMLDVYPIYDSGKEVVDEIIGRRITG